MTTEVFGVIWKIILTEDKEPLRANGKFCKGCTHYKDAEIYIYKDTSKRDRRRLLAHELGHAYLYETQVELKEHYTEEDMCEFLAKFGERIVKEVDRILSDWESE